MQPRDRHLFHPPRNGNLFPSHGDFGDFLSLEQPSPTKPAPTIIPRPRQQEFLKKLILEPAVWN
jgi:hypothetical protein